MMTCPHRNTQFIQYRSGIQATLNKKADCSVDLEIAKGIGTEGYRIEDVSRGRVRILAEDGRGLLYGGGKFLRTNTYHQGSFRLGNWRGTSLPEKKVRSIYFATHWFNFYHEAPIEKIERYAEDLAEVKAENQEMKAENQELRHLLTNLQESQERRFRLIEQNPELLPMIREKQKQFPNRELTVSGGRYKDYKK